MLQESKTTEFKREYTDDLKYAVVAFANTDGGKIYIGINDDGSVQGIENPDGTMLRITNMIRDVVRPDVTMFTECATERIDGKTVIILITRFRPILSIRASKILTILIIFPIRFESLSLEPPIPVSGGEYWIKKQLAFFLIIIIIMIR